MKDSIYTLLYAAVMGTVCAGLLTGVGSLVAPYREANARAEEVRTILGVLEIPFDAESSSQEQVEAFDRNVISEEREGLTIYFYVKGGSAKKAEAAALPFAGQGLWGPIEGFLALEPDMKTIRGVTFHKQEETPGLGGEIGSAWFQDQFKGRSIEDARGKPGIRIRRQGGAEAPNEVDGITGATMTCARVEKMLNAVIERVRLALGPQAGKEPGEHVQ